MVFCVHTNSEKKRRKARVHNISCYHCANRFVLAEEERTYSKWSNDYNDFSAAWVYAKATGFKNVKPCLHCLKGKKWSE